jgi:L-ascorbate metabolism protein UlaG (beta-lactamase superfamily)
VDGWRLLTDPTFDPPGRRYTFGWGSSSRKLTGPAIAATDLGPIDAVLLSHDHPGDNLDTAGRALLPAAGVVLTTVAGARRLSGNARGLQPWGDHPTGGPGTATDPDHRHSLPPRPAAQPPHRRRGGRLRHGLGRPGPRGPVDHWRHRAVRRLRQVADRLQVGTALLHLGCVRFPITGPVRYSMTAREAIQLYQLVRPQTAIPVHYEGWTHFHQDRPAIEREFARAPADISRSIRWLPIGEATTVAA